jgi:hypothetical protein
MQNRQRAVNRRASNPQQQQQLRCKNATTWDAARCIAINIAKAVSPVAIILVK